MSENSDQNIDDIDINDIIPNDEDNGWILELETALLSDCDLNIIKKITNQKMVPNHMRYEYWQVCLGIKGRHKVLSDIFDLAEQPLIRSDCQEMVDKFANEESERVAICSDVETIITNFSKLNQMVYNSENGWIEVLEPLLTLRLKGEDLFKVFEAIQLKYIPKCYNCSDSQNSEQSFHFLRLLLLYHEPELCSYLDTLKITPDLYAHTWFRSLFSGHCSHSVTLALWDTYFSIGNPFLIYFLALVMLVNEKDNIMSMPVDNKKAIIDYLSSVPKALCIEDIGDLFYLVEQHYVSRTPHTIKNLQSLLFQASEPLEYEPQISDLSHLLCLPVPVTDLLPNASNVNSVRYFCVDCRPAEQYNSGHLSTAFHLDCSLLLEEPSAFNTAVKALLAAQRQSIDEQSVAGGQHLCFLGSGRDEEDQYVHMVVASFLQKHHQFVSLGFGGYQSLHQLIVTNSDYERSLIDHNRKQCIVCIQPNNKLINNSSPGRKGTSSPAHSVTSEVEHFTSALFDRMASAVKPKMKEMKDKFVDYVTNPNQQQVVRHVSPTDKLGKRYKPSNRFTIDEDLESDDLESDSNDENAQEIDIEMWSKSPEIIGCFKCEEIKNDGSMCPSYLGLSNSHLFVLREISQNKRLAKIVAKRPLEMIVQITSKRRCPDLITFKYGHNNEGGEPTVVAKDHLLIPKPYDITRLIKQQVIRILDGETSSGSTSSSKASNK